jgi:excisionase family DNA binding protein
LVATDTGNTRSRPVPGRADGETRWVNLGRACEILGVNESTVRRWADAGRIGCFRTPGGHRRFSEDDLLTLTRRGPEPNISQAAVRRIRRKLQAGRDGGSGWHAELGADARDALRPLGRRLVELVGDYIAHRDSRGHEIEGEVDAIGRQYGQLLVQQGEPLLRAIEAFTFFRRSLDEAARHLAERNRLGPDEAADAREQIAGLADRVLLGVSAAYDGE